MTTGMRKHWRSATRFRPGFWSLVAAGLLLVPPAAAAQELTGALVVIVNDTQGGVLVGAVVRVSSPALIGGPVAFTTPETGRLRFQALTSGIIRCSRSNSRVSRTYRDEDIRLGGRLHDRKTGGPERGGARTIGRRPRGRGRASRHANPGLRESASGSEDLGDDPDATGQHVRLHQSSPRDIPHVPLERHCHHRVRVRLGHQREPVLHRWHELHVPV